jgi:hypothetical protein
MDSCTGFSFLPGLSTKILLRVGQRGAFISPFSILCQVNYVEITLEVITVLYYYSIAASRSSSLDVSEIATVPLPKTITFAVCSIWHGGRPFVPPSLVHCNFIESNVFLIRPFKLKYHKVLLTRVDAPANLCHVSGKARLRPSYPAH